MFIFSHMRQVTAKEIHLMNNNSNYAQLFPLHHCTHMITNKLPYHYYAMPFTLIVYIKCITMYNRTVLHTYTCINRNICLFTTFEKQKRIFYSSKSKCPKLKCQIRSITDFPQTTKSRKHPYCSNLPTRNLALQELKSHVI